MQYPPGYKDANDLFTRAENAGAIWERMIRDAKPSATWLIDGLSGKHDLSTAGGKCDAAADMFTMLLGMTPIERDHYTAQLAITLDVERHALRQHLNELYLQWRAEEHAQPERKPRPLVLDQYGECRDFLCPKCYEWRTHYSAYLKEWCCFACAAVGNVPDLAALQRMQTFAWERKSTANESEPDIGEIEDKPRRLDELLGLV